MTCKDCVYYPACTYHMWCDLFKNKADVVEVKHGEWLNGVTGYTCSVCDKQEPTKRFLYCPNCGAKMDGKGGCDEID